MIRERLAAKSSELFEAMREHTRMQEHLRESDRDTAMQNDRVRQLESQLDERDRRISDILITNEQLAEGAERQRDECRGLAQMLADKDIELDGHRTHIARCETAVQDAQDAQSRVEADCEFKLNIIEESKTSIFRELEIAKEELGAQQAELNQQ